MDNDCDGAADEDLGSEATTCGVGSCAAAGERTCTGGAWVDSCTPGTPAAEACDDGVDNDCDGYLDMEDPDCGIALPDLTGKWDRRMVVWWFPSKWYVLTALEISNIGDADAGSFQVRFFYVPRKGGTPQYLGQREIVGLARGQSRTILFLESFRGNPLGGTLRAVVDASGTVEEGDETNNETSKTISLF